MPSNIFFIFIFSFILFLIFIIVIMGMVSSSNKFYKRRTYVSTVLPIDNKVNSNKKVVPEQTEVEIFNSIDVYDSIVDVVDEKSTSVDVHVSESTIDDILRQIKSESINDIAKKHSSASSSQEKKYNISNTTPHIKINPDEITDDYFIDSGAVDQNGKVTLNENIDKVLSNIKGGDSGFLSYNIDKSSIANSRDYFSSPGDIYYHAGDCPRIQAVESSKIIAISHNPILDALFPCPMCIKTINKKNNANRIVIKPIRDVGNNRSMREIQIRNSIVKNGLNGKITFVYNTAIIETSEFTWKFSYMQVPLSLFKYSKNPSQEDLVAERIFPTFKRFSKVDDLIKHIVDN